MYSKSIIHYLQGQKQVSESYEHKLRSIIKKILANIIFKEITLLSQDSGYLIEGNGIIDFTGGGGCRGSHMGCRSGPVADP